MIASKNKRRRTGLYLIVGMVFATLIVNSVSYAGQINLYSLEIKGVVSGRSFIRQGTLGLATKISTPTENGVNPLELVIVSGNPVINSQTGAIQFATNTFFLGGRAAIDMAYVTYSNGCISAKPDGRVSAVGLNVFNATSGLTADIYQIFSGEIKVCSNDGFKTISGVVDILGTGSIFHSNTPYKASVSGKFIGSNKF